ncbi:hypothetical protein CEXT_435991 [Caerostris extrusa]|uniref:Uncharacterized protein n=1 Tax=Caerostris extrusa TaxID=172846 RepID=A0AAV4T566_CAEEX|nr:hypothetical protein CEXT_435991 [Caerostris extrusa]
MLSVECSKAHYVIRTSLLVGQYWPHQKFSAMCAVLVVVALACWKVASEWFCSKFRSLSSRLYNYAPVIHRGKMFATINHDTDGNNNSLLGSIYYGISQQSTNRYRTVHLT